MKDKDLLVVIAKMLRKQDQQTEILKNLMDISVKQFEQQREFNVEQRKFNSDQQQLNKEQIVFNRHQQTFNEKFLEVNERIVGRLERIEQKL